MAPEDRALCAAVDMLFERHGLDAPTQEALAAAAHDSLLGFLLNSFAIPPDAEVAAELQANPLASPAG